MKGFLRKRWHGIPVGIISALLVTCLLTSVVLAVLDTPQTITQRVYVPDIGSITAGDIVLPDLKVGKTYEGFPGTVEVVVGEDGAGKYLHMSLDEASADLYDRYRVYLETEDEVYFLEVYVGMPAGFPDILEASVGPLDAGTYTFTQYVLAIAGDTPGNPEVTVTYALKNNP